MHFLFPLTKSLVGLSQTFVGGAGPRDRQESISLKSASLGKKEIRKLWEDVRGASETPRAERNMSVKMYKGRKGFFLGKVQRETRGERGPGNTFVRVLLADRRFTAFILDFLGVGKVKEGVVLVLMHLRRGTVPSDVVSFLFLSLSLSFLSSFPFFGVVISS